MFEQIKELLLEKPEAIEHILDTFGFDRIRIEAREIRCAFEAGSNPTAVVIRLHDNPNLFVKRRELCYDYYWNIMPTGNTENTTE